MLSVQIKTKLPENCTFGTITEIMRNATMKLEGLISMGESVKGLLRVKAEEVEKILQTLPSYCEGIALSSKEVKNPYQGTHMSHRCTNSSIRMYNYRYRNQR